MKRRPDSVLCSSERSAFLNSAGLALTSARQAGLCAGLGGTRARLLGLWLLGTVVGCSHAPVVRSPALTGPVSSLEMEPLQLTLGKNGAEMDVVDAPTLFTQGGEHMDGDRFAEAAQSYDRIVKDFSDSPYVSPALFNAALSYEGLGRYADAIDRYRRLLDQFGSGKESKDAHFRLGACYAETSRWAASSETFAAALQRTDLNLSERIEALSRMGLAHFEMGDLQVAEKHFADSMALFKDHQSEERLTTDYFLAMSHFYVAHLAHNRFRALPLRLPQKQLEQDIDAKSKAFLAAQTKYVDAIKVKNVSWATASGYHVGVLYRELYDSLSQAPVPKELLQQEEAKVIYELAMRDKLRVLLEKAKDILAKNVEMAERVGVKNGWVLRSNEQLEELHKMLLSVDGTTGPLEKIPALPAGPVPPIPGRSPSSESSAGAAVKERRLRDYRPDAQP